MEEQGVSLLHAGGASRRKYTSSSSMEELHIDERLRRPEWVRSLRRSSRKGFLAVLMLILLMCLVVAANVALSVVLYIHYHDQTSTAPYDVICSYSCAKLCIGKSSSTCFNPCYEDCRNVPVNETSKLGASLRRDAIHHVGITVSNLTRSTHFYTEMLGGVLVPNAGGNNWRGDVLQNLLFQKEMLDGLAANKTLQQEEVANLGDNGTDVLSVCYINFGALQVELLEYHPIDNKSSHLPYQHQSSSPSIINNMHLSLSLKNDVDMNEFVEKLENTSLAYGYTNVKCNRIIYVSSEAERVQVGKQLKYNSYLIDSGAFQGWRFAYCKGPDGEQLELSQALGKAETDFDQALAQYLTTK